MSLLLKALAQIDSRSMAVATEPAEIVLAEAELAREIVVEPKWLPTVKAAPSPPIAPPAAAIIEGKTQPSPSPASSISLEALFTTPVEIEKATPAAPIPAPVDLKPAEIKPVEFKPIDMPLIEPVVDDNVEFMAALARIEQLQKTIAHEVAPPPVATEPTVHSPVALLPELEPIAPDARIGVDPPDIAIPPTPKARPTKFVRPELPPASVQPSREPPRQATEPALATDGAKVAAIQTPALPSSLHAIEPSIEPTAAVPEERDEIAELRNHLLTRYPLKQHSVLLFVDAGRAVGNSAWLLPLAASLLSHWQARDQRASPAAKSGQQIDAHPVRKSAIPKPTVPKSTAKILIVEAAGQEAEISRTLGCESSFGLCDVLHGEATWQTALRTTWHPQISLLARGSGPLPAEATAKISQLWSELKAQFDAVLVAAGPWQPPQTAGHAEPYCVATLLAPLADAAVLCLELGGTPTQPATAAKESIEASGLHLIGCVVRDGE